MAAADESTEHYESVVLWYGSPTQSLVLTDSFTMDSPGHQYAASNPVSYNVTSRYEKGVDHVGKTMVHTFLQTHGIMLTLILTV